MRFRIIESDVMFAHAQAQILSRVTGQAVEVTQVGRHIKVFAFEEDIKPSVPDGILLQAMFVDFNEGNTPRSRQYYAAGMCSMSPGHLIEISRGEQVSLYLCESNGWRRV